MDNSYEKFKAYFIVQESGQTNMFDAQRVIQLAYNYCNIELTDDDIIYIMKNYSELKEEYDNHVR